MRPEPALLKKFGLLQGLFRRSLRLLASRKRGVRREPRRVLSASAAYAAGAEDHVAVGPLDALADHLAAGARAGPAAAHRTIDDGAVWALHALPTHDALRRLHEGGRLDGLGRETGVRLGGRESHRGEGDRAGAEEHVPHNLRIPIGRGWPVITGAPPRASGWRSDGLLAP